MSNNETPPAGRTTFDAYQLGKSGQPEKAVQLYTELWREGALTERDKIAFGWQIFRAIQDLRMSRQNLSGAEGNLVRRHLFTYIKLGLPKPDLLHSVIGGEVVRFEAAHPNTIKLIPFFRLWDLKSFRPEDYEENTGKNGQTYQPLALNVLRAVAKAALKDRNKEELEFVLPYIRDSLLRFPDAIWLRWDLTKILYAMGEQEEAQRFALEVVRSKTNEHWAWHHLGALQEDPALRLACFAKALSCNDDDTFVYALRIQFADLLSKEHPEQAKAEMERAITHCSEKRIKLSQRAKEIMESDWFQEAEAKPLSRSLLNRLKEPAEDLLFAHLPWLDASLGTEFSVETPDGKKRRRRKLYVEHPGIPLGISVSASHPELREKEDGSPLRVQVEQDERESWRKQVRRIRPREEGAPYDVLQELIAVVDHVNHQRGLFHFLVSKEIDGIVRFADFQGSVKEGDRVAVRLAQHFSKRGRRQQVLEARPSEEAAPPGLLKDFEEEVEVRDGFGFTKEGIFLPRNLVSDLGLEDGAMVRGSAILNYDKKRRQWGWKAYWASAVG